MLGRRHVKTQNELMREELGEGFDHLRMAAAHAAGTAAAALTPRVDQVRGRLLEPTLDKSKGVARASAARTKDLARNSVRRASSLARRAPGKEEPRTARRWPKVVSRLLFAGTAVSAAGVLMSRRRQRQWNEYPSIGDTGTGATTGFRDDASSFTDSGHSTATSIGDTTGDKTNDVLGQLKGATETTKSTATSPSPHRTGAQTSELNTGEAFNKSATSTESRNNRP